jgi:peptide/nickel transport system substrate-binding protein
MRLPFTSAAQQTYSALSHTGRALFVFFAALLVVSTAGLLYLLNNQLLVAVPARGGEFSEGIIGSPRFINPVLAISDADSDLTALVYSGLLKATPNGDYAPDLATSYSVSSDGKTYTFNLRKDATFHDGTPITSDDVLFTIAKAQDPALKSPLLANWNGVAVAAPDQYTVVFTLKQPYAPFIKNLTLGILPKHLWQNVSDEEFPFSNLNTSPVGSGPFRVNSISRTPSGIPSSYDLRPFDKYVLGEPYLGQITLRFYQNENALVSALESGEVEAASELSPSSIAELKGFNILESPLNRVFGVFFNQNQSEVLRDVDVRRALSIAIDRKALVKNVLGGYGTPIDGPVPPSIIEPLATSTPIPSDTSTSTDPVTDAQNYLISRGWTLGPDGVLSKTTGKGKTAKTEVLSFNLATGNVPELRAAAQFLSDSWTRMGAKVTIQIFDQGDLSQNVIRPRKYDALLFGEVVDRELDLFAFWHSSQRNDPGLNIALYANSTADKLLEQLRATEDPTQRQSLYTQFDEELQRDIPAVFLYTPDFVYSVPNDIKGLQLGFIETPSDRFLSVSGWHRETDYVWPIFNWSGVVEK